MITMYYARLTDNDSSREVRFGKTIGPYNSGVVKVRVKFKSDVGGTIKVFLDEEEAGKAASSALHVAIGYNADTDVWFVGYNIISESPSEIFDTTESPSIWHVLEIEIDFTNALLTGRLYDSNGNLIDEKQLSLPSEINQLGVVTLCGVGGSQVGEAYFDDLEVYHDSSLVLSDDFDDGDVSDWNNYFGTGTFDVVSTEGEWSLQYKGRAIALRRGESGNVVFTIIPNGSTDTISVVVADSDGLNVSVNPSSVVLDGSNPVDVTISISVPSDKKYDVIWLVKVQFNGNTKSETGYVGVLPINKNANRVVIDTADQDESGYWAGAPEIYRENQYYYLLYRKRDPINKGYKTILARSSNLENWSIIKEWSTSSLGYTSTEKGSVVKTDKVYVLKCFGTSTGWIVRKVSADSIEQIEFDGVTVTITSLEEKDPEVIYDGTKYIIGVSAWTDSDHDIFIAESTDLSSYTVKIQLHSALINSGNVWAMKGKHIGHLGIKDDWIVVFYDGERETEPFAGKLGIALVSRDYSTVIDLTPDDHLIEGDASGATFRYVSIYYDDDLYVMVAEVGQADGSHDLILYYDGTVKIPTQLSLTIQPL